jgi:hypothetical protein
MPCCNEVRLPADYALEISRAWQWLRSAELPALQALSDPTHLPGSSKSTPDWSASAGVKKLAWWGQEWQGRLDAWPARQPVIADDSEIARVWGELAGAAQLRGGPAAERGLDRGPLPAL